MRTMIVGAGGVGGYLGARMTQTRQQVAFLLRPKTAEIVRQDGLLLKSPLGDWSGSVQVVHGDSGPFDLIVLSCKAYDLDSALQDIRPFARSGTYILPLLNGFRHAETISASLAGAHVLGGVAHIGATTDGPGKIIHLNSLATFLAGPIKDETPMSDDLANLFAMLDGDTITAKVVPDAIAQMWTKLVFLATLAVSTCLHRADIGTILNEPGGREAILATLAEAQAIAAAEGFDPPPDDLARYRAQLTETGSTATASMLRDVRAGRPTEVEHILGDLVTRAIAHDIEAPNLVAALWNLRAYEKQRIAA